jgi:hypothetical protein
LTYDGKGFDFGILIHGGASVEKIKRTDEITRALKSAVSYGFDLLKRSSNKAAVDSVEAAIASMEDSGEFDAGIGANITINHNVWGNSTINDLIHDAEKALNTLIHQPQVDPKNISIIGHSAGTIIGPRVAIDNPTNVKNIILMGIVASNTQDFALTKSILTFRVCYTGIG